MDDHSSKATTVANDLRHGIRIKALMLVLSFLAVTVTALFYAQSVRTQEQSQRQYKLETERYRCDDAIKQFMDASDYLTSQAQQFVITGERKYMVNYWSEVNNLRNRDVAIEAILSSNITAEERRTATLCKYESDTLINHEVWAMRMVAEGVGMPEYRMPPEVQRYKLNVLDSALSPTEKKISAINYIFGHNYALTKDKIRSNVLTFRNNIASRYSKESLQALAKAEKSYAIMKASIFVFLLLMFTILGLFIYLVIWPISSFSAQLKNYSEGTPAFLKPHGAYEIKQFALAFNKLYTQVELNTNRLSRLSYLDYLTDLPNRAAITEYFEHAAAQNNADLGLLMIDVDNFKFFNDTFGHTLGDQTLVQIAKAISAAQPEHDCLSGRLCGEEFTIIIPHTHPEELAAVAEKVLYNVRNIQAQDVGLTTDSGFGVTVSIGGALGATDFTQLLNRADKALYSSKRSGKDLYTYEN